MKNNKFIIEMVCYKCGYNVVECLKCIIYFLKANVTRIAKWKTIRSPTGTLWHNYFHCVHNDTGICCCFFSKSEYNFYNMNGGLHAVSYIIC